MNPPIIYVAGKYSGNVADNISKAELISIELIRAGYHVITPHKNTAHYEMYEDDQLTHQTWVDMDLNILSRCDILYVMNNWKTSPGTKLEIEFARQNNIVTYYEEFISPQQLITWVNL